MCQGARPPGVIPCPAFRRRRHHVKTSTAPFLLRSTDHDAAARLAREFGLHPVTAQVLASRGIREPEEARRFLHPGPSDLHDPRLFEDMDRATSILAGALRAERRIAVYGDYDVDGVCGTAVMVSMLRMLGGDVRPFLPHRVHDGYGLSADALARLQGEGCAVVVTVDNGTTRAAEIARARADGLEVIVTDHHEAGAEMPDCPVINPKRPGSTYPFSGLAGCGVAFKTGLGLAERLGRTRDRSFRAGLADLLALVAIGSVADVVPLRDENRSLVAAGLKALRGTRHPGLRALLDVARCADRRLYAADVAFRLGPRLNAAGRIGSADLALDLVLCADAERAATLAAELDAGNRERQRIEREQAEEAFAQAETFRDQPALVVAGEGWHPGVIGIVAARITETYHRPAALVTVEGDVARGSARCFGGVRLHEALARCAPLLLTHGGHAKAAGFTLRADRIDAFREAFTAACVAQGEPGEFRPRVDAELPLEAVSQPLAAEIDTLRPFGAGNEEPLFSAYNLRVAGRPRRVGPNEEKVIFFAATDRTAVRAVARRVPDEALRGAFHAAFVLRRRDGPEPVEIHVRKLVPAR